MSDNGERGEPPSTFLRTLQAVSRFFSGDADMQETLMQVAQQAVVAVPAADFVGITMMVRGHIGTGVFTDHTAPQVDQAQYDSEEGGPCVEAFRTGQVFEIKDTAEPGRWPTFRRACVRHGIRSTLSEPLAVDDIPVGGFNLYSARPDAFGPADRELSAIFAAQAAIVLANAQAYWDALTHSEQLGEAMSSRAVIEQAKGLIIGATGVSAEQAFEQLSRQSQHENVKLRTVAERLIQQATRPRRSPG